MKEFMRQRDTAMGFVLARQLDHVMAQKILVKWGHSLHNLKLIFLSTSSMAALIGLPIVGPDVAVSCLC
jgi:hypothetical protein